LAFAGSVLGLIFASLSTIDYAAHLDRRLHDLHCSLIPGLSASDSGEACRTAMYSSYSAVFKTQYWGGLPISLLAVGAFTFFAGFALYLLISADRAPAKSVRFFAAVSVTPLLVSLMMLTISLTRLGSLCKTCVGIYISSFLLALGGVLGLWTLKPSPPADLSPPRPVISSVFSLVWLVILAFATLTPALVYAGSVPEHERFLTKCGEMVRPSNERDSLVKMRTGRSTQAATLFEDPLCPTCRAFHQRLLSEDVFDKLDVELAMFPLDSECNWMLQEPLHPGACIVAKAVLCAGDQSRQFLEWAYDEQPYLTRAGKAGAGTLRAVIQEKWGSSILQCVDSRATKMRLENHLHFAVDNNLPVSTPQMFLGKRRVCDEDTDIGLMYTLKHLAPEVLR
jgi:uncharacterized membrane protein